MALGRIQEIWRYPVKSMGGEQLGASRLGARGIPGDRTWAIRDEQAGEIRGARHLPALLLCSARCLEEPAESGSPPVEVALPDGSRLRSDDPSLGDRLSKLVGGRLRLCALRPAEDLDHYRRAIPKGRDLAAEIRAQLGRLEGEPLPDLAAFPRELLAFASPPGTYFDAFPLHILSSVSLAELRRHNSNSSVDRRRFRANLVVEVSGRETGCVEFGWCGKTLRIGEALVDATLPTFRCAIPTHPQPGLPKDPTILRTIVRETGQNLGIYATVRTPGRVAVGDEVELA